MTEDLVAAGFPERSVKDLIAVLEAFRERGAQGTARIQIDFEPRTGKVGRVLIEETHRSIITIPKAKEGGTS